MRTIVACTSQRQIDFLNSKIDGAEFYASDASTSLTSMIGIDNAVVIIPSVLNLDSAASYDGIELALECYFHIIDNELLNSRIVILGFEEKGAFYDHCSLSDIVRCPGVVYAKSAKEALSYAQFSPDSIIEKQSAIKALKMVRVTPPAAFKSHHTVVNEWSIMRWSKFLGFSPKSLESLNSLYFKYLKCTLPIEPTSSFRRASDKLTGKVLVIDDEIGKGWKDFYDQLLKPYENVTYKAIGDSFKTKSQEKIIQDCESEIETFDPDIVIVDLRLHESDLDRISDEKKNRITGVQIIENIKSLNRGIQVIGVTASSKVWNYQKVQDLVDGYIVKESPELSTIDGYTGRALKSLTDTLFAACERRYLKDIFIQKNSLIGRIRNLRTNDCNESIITHLEMAFHLEEIAKTPEQYAFAYISLYQIFELFVQHYYYDIDESIKDEFIPNIKYIYQRIWCGKNYIFEDSIRRIYSRRNSFIHQNKAELQRLPGSNIFNKNGFLDAFNLIKETCERYIEYES